MTFKRKYRQLEIYKVMNKLMIKMKEIYFKTGFFNKNINNKKIIV